MLFLAWKPENVLAVRAELQAMILRCSGVAWTFLEIDNADPERPFEEIGGSPVVECRIGGDNTHQEFSGWDKGWMAARQHFDERFDVVVIANDALKNSKPYRQIQNIDNDLLRGLARTNGAIGWLDSYVDVSPTPLDLISTPMEILGHASRWWVCTTFIVFSARLFRRVLPLTNFDSFDRVYVNTFDGTPFRADCGLNRQYQDFLITHQARVWYKKYELNAETFGLFRSKTAMIINEQLIGTRIERARGKVVDLRVLEKPLGRRDKFFRRLPLAGMKFRHLARVTRKAVAEKIDRARAKVAAAAG